jgi:hypothetical protein
MRQKLADPAPGELLEVQRDFDAWRSTHPRRTPFPESLWAAAAAAAAEHGIYRTAKLLRLDPTAVKRKMPGTAPAPAPAPPTFVELLASGSPPPECVIEIERPRQGKLRLELKAWRTVDVADVVRQLWSCS